jgi:hypothetical protein
MATFYEPLKTLDQRPTSGLTSIESYLLNRASPTFASYYNGKMSYSLHGKEWDKFVAENFEDLGSQTTSENVFKTVIDLYAENLVPQPDELKGFSNSLVPLLSRGECPALVDSAGTPHFPEHYEMVSDGLYTAVAIFTRSLETMQDFVTFAYSDGTTKLYAKDTPADLSAATKEGYQFVEVTHNNQLFRFALDDKGFGASLAALQDRVNHSIVDQTVVAEMYTRPFWYLLNYSAPPRNPYLPATSQTGGDAMEEQKTNGASGRIFTTSADGPFGQLEPPTIQDMIAYHDSIADKLPQSFGIPAHYFKPGSSAPPTGVALKVLSKRFNNKVARMREDIEPEMEKLADVLGVEKTREVTETKRPTRESITLTTTSTPDQPVEPEMTQYEYEFWNTGDDLLQESLDAHGISLSQMGYPLAYIAEVVTPGVDLDDYADDSLGEQVPPGPGVPTDMTAIGQRGLPATPGQVAAYATNPGQRAVKP